ncbi:flagellar basal body L-ring protein FlgH [Flavimaricola marinus]|uniref:Flagellar L-ring protein n=1 Tax=Flavimaricola marinus TaxID=1819565 RepID=A0A238LH68_9RHOB|nr:flagellar basal body L-ring protein FlgH [Flavimaricola marinus]SMY08230.1 Flagellar L-ring protein precursor [Flavimaricola marinus]
MSISRLMIIGVLGMSAACAQVEQIGQEPPFTPVLSTTEHTAMMTASLPQSVDTMALPPTAPASLWTGDRGSLLGDRRAMQRGDILTVVIEIDDSAQINNSSDRSRSGNQEMQINDLFGLPQRINEDLPGGASLDSAVGLGSSSTFSGTGSVQRNERLTLRVAATVVDVLPNGVLSIEGSQQVRVNFEMRELLVSGFVRPADITRQNEVTYDKIASARIAYGGRGQISDVQQPRYGQQAAEILLPF